MSKCYRCKDEITKNNRSKEHIIQNALLGNLKSDKLLCDLCNNKLGEELDAELVRQIPIPNIIKQKRDKGESPDLIVKDDEGNSFLLKNKDKLEQLPKKPKYYIDANGKEVWECLPNQIEGVLKAYLKKHPEAEEATMRNRLFTTEEQGVETEVFFDGNFNIISGEKACRAVAKIAVNHYIDSFGGFEFCPESIDFVLNGKDINDKVKYHYPSNYYRHGVSEFSHLLYSIGNYSERILYSFVELFNVHCFIVIHSTDYSGPNFSSSYFYDIDSRNEFGGEIELDLSRSELLALPRLAPDNVEECYMERLERLAEIKGLQLTKKDIPQ